MTTLQDALTAIAPLINANPDDLIQFASEDTLGGWSPNPNLAKWPIGSIFGEEGQVIYALTRALKPQNVINIGVYHGCSIAHIAAALKMNGNPKARVHAVDLKILDMPLLSDKLRPYVVEVESDGLTFLEGRWPAKTTLIMEDALHDYPNTKAMLEVVKRKANLGAITVVHDVSHHIVGSDVKNAVVDAGMGDGTELLIDPSDCGLWIWKQNKDV
jgi:predicted O-methyltransferase YrrM